MQFNPTGDFENKAKSLTQKSKNRPRSHVEYDYFLLNNIIRKQFEHVKYCKKNL